VGKNENSESTKVSRLFFIDISGFGTKNWERKLISYWRMVLKKFECLLKCVNDCKEKINEY